MLCAGTRPPRTDRVCEGKIFVPISSDGAMTHMCFLLFVDLIQFGNCLDRDLVDLSTHPSALRRTNPDEMVCGLLNAMAYDSNRRVGGVVMPLLRAQRKAGPPEVDSKGKKVFEVLSEYFTYRDGKSPTDWSDLSMAYVYIHTMGSE